MTGRAGALAAALIVLAALAFAPGGGALAQASVCNNEPETATTPGTGQRVHCQEESNDISIDIDLDG